MSRITVSAVAAALLVPPAAFAATELAIPTVICVPGNRQTIDFENKPITAGVTRQAGRNTPPRMYFCPVFPTDFAATPPSWKQLRLTYADNTTARGNIVVRLFAKSRAKTAIDPPLGTTFVIGQVASVPAVGVSVVTAALTASMDFHRFSYWFVLDMPSPAGSTSPMVDAHEIQLTD